jgi:adenosylmethionine-8-amino-7-oxononanoate aminotransferase
VGGCADGFNGDHIMIAPPFVVSDDEISLITERLSGALDKALSNLDD